MQCIRWHRQGFGTDDYAQLRLPGGIKRAFQKSVGTIGKPGLRGVIETRRFTARHNNGAERRNLGGAGHRMLGSCTVIRRT